VEGVQPSISQNPTASDSRNLELASKGPNANSTLAAMSGSGDVSVKPLVKHVLSKELQLYFEKVCSAVLDENSEEFRTSGYSSLREDPGLHQLVPYFIQFIAEKVTHSLKDIFVLTQVMHMAEALVQNQSLYVDPYVSSPLLFLFIHHSVRPLTELLDCLPCPLHLDLSHRSAARWRS
jgi:transcription initiation factor TFIID subunit 6